MLYCTYDIDLLNQVILVIACYLQYVRSWSKARHPLASWLILVKHFNRHFQRQPSTLFSTVTQRSSNNSPHMNYCLSIDDRRD